MGHQVSVSHPYELQYLKIRTSVLKALKSLRISAVLLTSPSCFHALRHSFSLKELRSWELAWLVIGPTTKKALKGSGLKVQMAAKPTLDGLKRLALKL